MATKKLAFTGERDSVSKAPTPVAPTAPATPAPIVTPTSTSTMGAVGRGEYTPEYTGVTPSAPVQTPVAMGAVQRAEYVDVYPTTAPKPPTPITQPIAPGKAWIWDGKAWVKPAIPDNGTEKDYTWDDNTGWTKKSVVTSTASAQFSAAQSILAQYNITGFLEALAKIRSDYPDADSATILQLFQYDPKYNEAFLKRFAGNKARQAAGLPMISAADYLAMEQGYKKLFTSYNLPKFTNQAMYDSLIANDLDVTEATDRVVLAYDRLMSDKSALDAFKRFFPALTNEDIVSAMLNPKEQIPELKRKVTAAEVGGQAAQQALMSSYGVAQDTTGASGYTNVQRGTIGAEAAVAAGATKQSAGAAYQRIAYELPLMEKLSSIYAYGLDQYSQKEAEQERIQGLASAARKGEALIRREQATWTGSAGTGKGSFGGGRSNVIQNPRRTHQHRLVYKTGSKSRTMPPNSIVAYDYNEQKGWLL